MTHGPVKCGFGSWIGGNGSVDSRNLTPGRFAFGGHFDTGMTTGLSSCWRRRSWSSASWRWRWSRSPWSRSWSWRTWGWSGQSEKGKKTYVKLFKICIAFTIFFQGYLHHHSVWRNKIWLSTTAFLNVFDLSMRTLHCSMYQIFFSCEKFVKLLKFQRTVQSQFYWLEIFLKFRKSQHYCAVSSSHIELKIENIA